MQKYQESNFSFIFCFLTRSKYVTHLVSPQSTVLDDSIGCALWFAARGQGILTCSQCIEDIKEPSMSCGCRPSYTCPAKVCAAYFRMVKQISLGCQTVLICVMTHSFYTAKNAADLLQVVNFTDLLQLVNVSQQIYGVFGCEASFFHLTTLNAVFH